MQLNAFFPTCDIGKRGPRHCSLHLDATDENAELTVGGLIPLVSDVCILPSLRPTKGSRS